MFRKIATVTLILIIPLYLILLIPGPTPKIRGEQDKKPFAWSRDAYWRELEDNFKRARNAGCERLSPSIALDFAGEDSLLNIISVGQLDPQSSTFNFIETGMFHLASMIAACPAYLNDYRNFTIRLRNLVKRQSIGWDMSADMPQAETYRLLYGARAAYEEIMLQVASDSLNPLMLCNDEPSATPFTRILGATVHSGDILISRGGAPTSALIARGSNYQGNFSHAALVYVDPKTSLASIIESHIERGVTVSSLENYLKDKKLRVMVLRLRHDLPVLIADPTLPHEIALAALNEAGNHHIPYDFEMNSQDNSRKFCSEVVLDPYAKAGIRLWAKTSSISSPGVVRWLSYFGVTHFETQEPSDLEYDPQLTVVAEWRDLETLYQDHIDNAVTDAMLEGAENGDRLTYNRFLLPVARVLKVYSWILNRLGGVGPIPEGMSAEAALRNKWYSEKHGRIKALTISKAADFQVYKGYRPPYWELLNLARQAKSKTDKSL